MPLIYGVTTAGSVGGGQTGGTGIDATNAFTLQGITQSNSSINLTINGNGIENLTNMLIIPERVSALMNVKIIAETDAYPRKTASWEIFGCAKRESAPASLQILGFSPAFAMSDPELQFLKVSLYENTSYGGISIQCKGIPQYTVIRWIATITMTEV